MEKLEIGQYVLVTAEVDAVMTGLKASGEKVRVKIGNELVWVPGDFVITKKQIIDSIGKEDVE